jgi:hypothetical protein
MVDENALRETLVVMNQIMKSQYNLINAMATRMEALERTVKVLDPTFSEVMEWNWNEETASSAEIGAPVIEVFDDLIQRLKDGLVC